MTIWSIVLDVVVVIVLISAVMRGKRDGFLKSFVLFIGTIASMFVAGIVSKFLASMAYQNFIRDKIAASISTATAGVTDSNQLFTALQGAFTHMSGWMGKLAQMVHTDFTPNQAGQIFGQASNNLAQTVADQLFAPLVTALLATILFFIIFILCGLLFRLIAQALQIVNHVPLVGTVNRLLGMLFGVANGAFALILISFGFYLIVLVTAGKGGGIFSMDTVEASVLFQYVMDHNPLLSLV